MVKSHKIKYLSRETFVVLVNNWPFYNKKSLAHTLKNASEIRQTWGGACPKWLKTPAIEELLEQDVPQQLDVNTPASLTEEDKVEELDKGKFTAIIQFSLSQWMDLLGLITKPVSKNLNSETNLFTLFGDV